MSAPSAGIPPTLEAEAVSNIGNSSVRAITPTSVQPAPQSSRVSTKSKLSLTDQTNLLPFRKVFIVFSSLSLCILVSTLDATIVATALPTISNHFNAGSIASWVPSAYFLTSTAFQPLCASFICLTFSLANAILQMAASVIFSAEKRPCASLWPSS